MLPLSVFELNKQCHFWCKDSVFFEICVNSEIKMSDTIAFLTFMNVFFCYAIPSLMKYDFDTLECV